MTGSHNIKAGVQWAWGTGSAGGDANGDLVQNYSNGTPTGVTVYLTPFDIDPKLDADLGLYIQDQWTIDRLTINAGLRYEYLEQSVGETQKAAGRFSPATTWDAVNCDVVPGMTCWSSWATTNYSADSEDRSNTYTGFETGASARLGRGITAYGAWTMDKTVDVSCDATDNPNTLRFCDNSGNPRLGEPAIDQPFRHEFKFGASVPLWYGVETSAALQSYAGAPEERQLGGHAEHDPVPERLRGRGLHARGPRRPAPFRWRSSGHDLPRHPGRTVPAEEHAAGLRPEARLPPVQRPSNHR